MYLIRIDISHLFSNKHIKELIVIESWKNELYSETTYSILISWLKFIAFDLNNTEVGPKSPFNKSHNTPVSLSHHA